MNHLEEKKVAILATGGFEGSELVPPMKALKGEGAQMQVVLIKSAKIKIWQDGTWAGVVNVDKTVDEV